MSSANVSVLSAEADEYNPISTAQPAVGSTSSYLFRNMVNPPSIPPPPAPLPALAQDDSKNKWYLLIFPPNIHEEPYAIDPQRYYQQHQQQPHTHVIRLSCDPSMSLTDKWADLVKLETTIKAPRSKVIYRSLERLGSYFKRFPDAERYHWMFSGIKVAEETVFVFVTGVRKEGY